MNFSDLQRRLENIVRIGTIADVDVSDTQAPRVRVQDGDLLTTWLPFGALRAGTARVWSVPTVGEQVIMLSPSGELASAVVFGSLFCAGVQAPSTNPKDHIIDFADGTRISHNDATGAMVFMGMRTLLLQASESVTVETATMRTTATNSITNDTPATSLNGTVTHAGDKLQSNGVVLHTHTHSGVLPGPARTGGPQ